MRVHISYSGLKSPEHIQALQAVFQEGALGRTQNSSGNDIVLEAAETDMRQAIGTLQAKARQAGFVILQDDESFVNPGVMNFRALSL